MKRWQAYTISGLFTVILFASGFYILVRMGFIHFDWTDQWMRQNAYEKARSSDRRMLVLGDSQLEKWVVKPCLFDALEDYCDQHDIGYVNAAHYGFGPLEYLDQLKSIAPDYKPDLILVFIYVGNDLSDIAFRNNRIPHKRTYQVAFPEMKDSQYSPSREQVAKNNQPSTNNSQLTNEFDWDHFAKSGISSRMIQYAKNRLEHPQAIGTEYVNPHLLVLGSWHPDFIKVNLTEELIISKAAWYHAYRNMEDLILLSDSIGAQVCLITIPSTVQVDTSHFAFYRELLFDLDPDLVYANTPQRNWYRLARMNGIPYLDLLPYFKTSDKSDNLYFENDDHLNQNGHELAFQTVKKQLLTAYVESRLVADRDSFTRLSTSYHENIIRFKMEEIRSDQSWFQDIRRKASVNAIPVDSQLYLDARFILDLE